MHPLLIAIVSLCLPLVSLAQTPEGQPPADPPPEAQPSEAAPAPAPPEAAPAPKEAPIPGDWTWSVRFGLGMQFASEADLADMAGNNTFGSDDDQSAADLAVTLGATLVWRRIVEASLRSRLAVGGLDIGAVEERYFGMADEVGGTSNVALGLSVWATPALGDVAQLVAGGSMGMRRSVTASGVGSALLQSLYVGPELGIRFFSTAISKTTHGSLELLGHFYWHKPTRVDVESGDNTLFESTSPDGSFSTYGGQVSYVITFL